MATPRGRRGRKQSESSSASAAEASGSRSTTPQPQRPAAHRKRQLSSASSSSSRLATEASSSSTTPASDHRSKKARLSLPVPSLGLGRIGRTIGGGIKKLVTGSSDDADEAASQVQPSTAHDEQDVERALLSESSAALGETPSRKGKARQPPDDDAMMLDPDAEEDAGDDDDDSGEGTSSAFATPPSGLLDASTAEMQARQRERERMARLSPDSFSHRQLEGTLLRNMRRRDEAASLRRPYPSQTSGGRGTPPEAAGDQRQRDASPQTTRDPPLRDPLAEAVTPPPDADELLSDREAARQRIRAILGEGSGSTPSDANASAGSNIPSPLGFHGDGAGVPASHAPSSGPVRTPRFGPGAHRPHLVLPLPRNTAVPGGADAQPQQPSALMALMSDILGMNGRFVPRGPPGAPGQPTAQQASQQAQVQARLAQASARQAVRRARAAAAAARGEPVSPDEVAETGDAPAAAAAGGLAPGAGPGSPLFFGTPPPQQQDGTGAPRNDAGRPATPATLSGGTTVIVQGALVSRTLPPRQRQQQRGAAATSRRRATSAGPEIGATPQRPQRTYGSPSSGLPSGDATEDGRDGQGATTDRNSGGDDELGQAATLEEQATMLSRLLSLATAATAASLITGGGATQVSAAGLGQGAASNASGATSTTNGSNADASASSSVRGAFSGLRDRLFSFARSRPRPETETTSAPPAAPVQPPPPLPAVAGGTGDIQGPLGALTQMLRDAIRDGFHTGAQGVNGRAEQAQPAPDPTSSTSPQRPNTRSGSMRRTASSGRIHIGRRTNVGSSRDGSRSASSSSQSDAQPQPSSPASSSSTRTSASQAPRGGSPPDASALRAQHEAQAAAVNATLERIRSGTPREGDPGSFDRFLFDLDNDLRAAVRVLPFDGVQGTSSDGETAAGGAAAAEGAEILDGTDDAEHREGTEDEALLRERRRRDVQAGQLNFFRLFRFPAGSAAWGVGPQPNAAGVASTVGGTMGGAPNGTTTVGATPPAAAGPGAPTAAAAGAAPTGAPAGPQAIVLAPQLVPCVVVGVRSLASHETLPGDNAAGGAPTQAGGRRARQDSQVQTQATPPTAEEAAEGDSAGAGPGHAQTQTDATPPANANGTSTSRYLLFVSGGAYHPSHPLLTATSEQATRDLMLLMEVMSAMAAAQAQAFKNQTATQEQIDRSNLRKVKGGEMKRLAESGEVKENTSERCLICLEDWADEDEVRVLSCLHGFHTPCVDKWITASSNSCPLCRANAVKTQQTQQSQQGGSGNGGGLGGQGQTDGEGNSTAGARTTAAL